MNMKVNRKLEHCIRNFLFSCNAMRSMNRRVHLKNNICKYKGTKKHLPSTYAQMVAI